MRGYGLAFNGINRFASTQSIRLGGVVISRAVYINTSANWGRWLPGVYDVAQDFPLRFSVFDADTFNQVRGPTG